MYGEITWPLNCRNLLVLAVQILLTSHYRVNRRLPTEAGCIVLFSSHNSIPRYQHDVQKVMDRILALCTRTHLILHGFLSEELLYGSHLKE